MKIRIGKPVSQAMLARAMASSCLASDLRNGAYIAKPSFTFKIKKLERILGQRNSVLAVSTGVFNDVPTHFCDVYRRENSKKVEHWDVLQEIK